MLSLFIQREVFDPNMRLISSRAELSRSFIKNFLGILYRNMGRLTFSLRDVDGSTRSLDEDDVMMHCPMAQGGGFVFTQYSYIDQWGYKIGIGLGTGTAVVSARDYCIAAIIPHGTGVGEIKYFGGNINDVVIDGSDAYFDIERIFQNGSGSSIIIKEFGLAVIAGDYSTLIIRDAYSDAGDWTTVADGEYLKVTYRIKVTV